MAILDSLLTAIMRADGDALVLHVGERPYVVTGAGNVDLSKTVLTIDGVSNMLAQLVPNELLTTLSEVGAVEHQLQPPSAMRDAFTVVAARGGDDIWIEVRRKRAVVRPVAVASVPEVPAASEAPEVLGVSEVRGVPSVPGSPAVPKVPQAVENVATPEVAAVAETRGVYDTPEAPPVGAVAPAPEAQALVEVPIPPAVRTTAEVFDFTEMSETVPAPELFELNARPHAAAAEDFQTAPAAAETPTFAPELRGETPNLTEPESSHVPEAITWGAPVDEPRPVIEHQPVDRHEGVREPAEGVNVVPLPRVVRVEASPRRLMARENFVERLLTAAAARSAEQIYLTSQSRPFFRVEGEMRPVDNEPIFSSGDIDAIVLELMPESVRESHGRGEPADWTAEFEGIGRVRCATFRDHRGPGVVFHLTTTRPISAEQLGLPRDIQALATEPEGLLLVAGPRGGGKSTLMGAMVDLINRQHSVSVITIERQIRIVHENRLALVSQREVRGTGADAMAVARAALRENPDVLVLEDLKSPEIVQFALDAAGTGRLVVLAVTAGSTVSALTRVVEAFPLPSRKAAQAALAERLRGAVSQVLLRKTGGGRIAARELMLPTHAIGSLISDGQLAQLATAMESGRKYGMTSLNDVLRSLVKNGSVDASEAYRKADNRAALLALLEHDGVDTSLLARLA